jgi:hypothetical protein
MGTKNLITLIGLFSLQIFPLPAFATYQSLPTEGGRTCPAHGEFFQDHFCWLGTTANNALKCVACPKPADDSFIPGRIIRGGEPSPSGVVALKGVGVRMILDLRTNGETNKGREGDTAASNGIAYFHLPMDTGGAGQTQKNKQALMRAMGLIRYFQKENQSGLVYFHCQRGEDRTGLIGAGVRNLLQGRERTEVRKEMAQHYFNFHYAALLDVWNGLTPEDVNKITEPSAEDKALIQKTVN